MSMKSLHNINSDYVQNKGVDRVTSKPKLVISIRENDLKLLVQGSSKDRGFFSGAIELEIGNVGKELTTIVGVELLSDQGHKYLPEKSSKLEFGTILMQKGEARIHNFYFRTITEEKWTNAMKMTLMLRELSGKKHYLSFPLERGSPTQVILR